MLWGKTSLYLASIQVAANPYAAEFMLRVGHSHYRHYFDGGMITYRHYEHTHIRLTITQAEAVLRIGPTIGYLPRAWLVEKLHEAGYYTGRPTGEYDEVVVMPLAEATTIVRAERDADEVMQVAAKARDYARLGQSSLSINLSTDLADAVSDMLPLRAELRLIRTVGAATY